MHRTWRYILNSLTALSLLLCIAAAIFWARSYRKTTTLGPADATQFISGNHWAEIGSTSGKFYLLLNGTGFVASYNPPSRECRFTVTSPIAQVQANSIREAIAFPWRDSMSQHDWFFGSWEEKRIRPPIFQPSITTFPPRPAPASWPTYRMLTLQPWSVVAALAILPLLRLPIWLLRRRQARNRRQVGLCPNCQYDLRATPHRCPECGHERR